MYTFQEIVTQKSLDNDVSFMFVEGDRDLSFWRKVIPITERNNTQIIQIRSLSDLDAVEGGEKGRLILLSNLFQEHGLSERIRVFVDADNDYISSKEYTESVLLTDFRDLEAYCFQDACLNEFFETGLAKSNIDVQKIKENLVSLSLPIGFLRYVSEHEDLKLPFQKSFDKNGRRKFMDRKQPIIDRSKLVTTLLQNAKVSVKECDRILGTLDDLTKTFETFEVRKIIQGKDWLFFLGELFDIPSDQVESQLFLALDYDSLTDFTNVRAACDFVCAA
ncbi:DUF4435 domain-containing protein [Photobacterium atrarenae]|uniref:DUF4435 domain-containing protein n=1 Tax=Photobacterium atrarenae TaxID=865757 RepID=A0ABY5GL99_9GAMM|nr:DUF4435 domain-containing protein [Photobacterium atrarenae]UTV29911.1 DUF4435 domain-containing protein [Photobacterium atrarenae]